MNKSIEEKIHGAIFGYAIGDALGFGTEFMTRRTIKKKYPYGLKSFSQIIQDAHRAIRVKGSITNDTLLLGLLIDTICEVGHPDALAYARRLSRWHTSDPMDLTQVMRWVLSQPEFFYSPFEAAKYVKEHFIDHEAPPDALGRALITGIWNENVKENTREITQITMPIAQCVGAGRIVARMANSLMWENKTASFGELKEIAETKHPSLVEYVEKARYGSLEDLSLDEDDESIEVCKGMGAALWAAWHCQTPEEALLKIVNQGGDANTNASLGTALVSLRTGFSTIPRSYVDNLFDYSYVKSVAEKFTDVITEKFGQKAD